MATQASKVDVDPNFDTVLHDLQEHAALAAEALKSADQVTWFRPAAWAGDPFDYEAIGPAFNRDQANQQYVEAVQSAQAPGVVGDLIAATLQVDYLAVMERAFRNRHTMTRPRRVCHVLGRKNGQGDQGGGFIQGVLEYVRRRVAQAKGPT